MKNRAYIFGRRIPGSTESVMTQERLDEIKSEVKNAFIGENAESMIGKITPIISEMAPPIVSLHEMG